MRRNGMHIGGFTLIELLVALAIVGILASIAVPAYTDYVIRGRIPQAHNNLSDLRIRLEQYYQDNLSYPDNCSKVSLPAADDFTYSCPTLKTDEFLAQAQGTGVMSGFTYTIDHANNRVTTEVPSGWGTKPISCWVTGKGGKC